jgi:hypothetical protein
MESKIQNIEDKRSLMGLPREQLSEALNVLDIPERQKKICVLIKFGVGFTIKVQNPLMR